MEVEVWLLPVAGPVGVPVLLLSVEVAVLVVVTVLLPWGPAKGWERAAMLPPLVRCLQRIPSE